MLQGFTSSGAAQGKFARALPMDRGGLFQTCFGAVTRHHRGEEPKSSEKARHMRGEKVAIAEAAATLVGDGMTIAIGAGTTTTELARVLRRRSSITVITNSITVFEVLTASDADDGPAAYLSGGARTPSDALVGPIADTALASFRVDATFLGVHGFDVHAGLTSPNIAEAQTNRTLIEIADRLVISKKTVGTHIEHILGKLGVRSRAEAVAAAYRESLVP